MGWKDLDSFNFEARENIVFFYRRRDPLYWAVTLAVALAVVVFGILSLRDPQPGFRRRGRGAAMVALIAAIPPAPRAVLLAVILGWLLECMIRKTLRIYDRRPDFLIGPSGVADLDPWNPRALRWEEIREVRLDTRRTMLRRKVRSGLAFVGRPKAPRFLPRRSVDWLPPGWTENAIRFFSRELEVSDDELIAIARRFAGGRLVVREAPWPFANT